MTKKIVKLIRKHDASMHHDREAWLYPGIWAMFFHRAAHRLYNRKHFFKARLIAMFSRFMTGIEIHPGAIIGQGVFIDHGMGVVIGETCVIGNNVLIYHGVTLGATGKERRKHQRHPMVGDNVVIGAGATVLGPITVGNYAKIGAGAIVIKDVPEGVTKINRPAKTLERTST